MWHVCIVYHEFTGLLHTVI